MSRTLFASVATAALLVAGAATADDHQKRMDDGQKVQTEGQQAATQDAQASLDQMTAEDIVGMTVKDQAGEDVGEIGSIVRSDPDRIEALIIEHGGFLGLGEKKLVLERGQIGQITQDGITINMAKDQIAQLPRYKQEAEQDQQAMADDPQAAGQENGDAARTDAQSQTDAGDGNQTAKLDDQDLEEARGNQIEARRDETPGGMTSAETEVEEEMAEAEAELDEETTDARQAMTDDAGAAMADQQQAQSDEAERQRMEQQTAATYPQNATDLIGQDAYSANGEDVGEVSDILVDDQGQPTAVIIDHGGWLGLGEKQIAIEWSAVQVNRDGVTVDMPSQQLSELPEFQGELD